MGGEGSMLAMIVSLKNNRAMLRSRRKKALHLEAFHHSKGLPDPGKKMPPAEFEAFRKKLRRERRYRDSITAGFLLLVFVAASFLFYLMFKALFMM